MSTMHGPKAPTGPLAANTGRFSGLRVLRALRGQIFYHGEHRDHGGLGVGLPRGSDTHNATAPHTQPLEATWLRSAAPGASAFRSEKK